MMNTGFQICLKQNKRSKFFILLENQFKTSLCRGSLFLVSFLLLAMTINIPARYIDTCFSFLHWSSKIKSHHILNNHILRRCQWSTYFLYIHDMILSMHCQRQHCVLKTVQSTSSLQTSSSLILKFITLCTKTVHLQDAYLDKFINLIRIISFMISEVNILLKQALLALKNCSMGDFLITTVTPRLRFVHHAVVQVCTMQSVNSVKSLFFVPSKYY